MKYLFAALVLFTGLSFGCCAPISRVEPSYPSKVSGWLTEEERLKFDEKHGFMSRGEFVLRKGEATDDGKIRVKLIDLIPPEPCAEGGAFQRQARVKLQFVRVSDQKALCEDIFPENGAGTVSPSCGESLNEFEIDVVGVYKINLKEGWAFFRL